MARGGPPKRMKTQRGAGRPLGLRTGGPPHMASSKERLSRNTRLSVGRSYGTITVNSPGVTKVITPPQMQFNIDTLSSVG